VCGTGKPQASHLAGQGVVSIAAVQIVQTGRVVVLTSSISMAIAMAVTIPIGVARARIGSGVTVIQVSQLGWWWERGLRLTLGLRGVGWFPTIASVSAGNRAEIL